MESQQLGPTDRDDSEATEKGLNPELSADATSEPENAERRKHHHEDHHVNRKYRIFSNHSSYGDSPHTNTSF